MAMRAGTALMGHMGLELNLLSEPAAELEVLKTAIALYKTYRDLLHTGDFYRLDTADDLNVVGVVAVDQSRALYSVALLKSHAATLPGRVYFRGLDPLRHYRLRLVWPDGWRSKSSPSVVDRLDLTGAGALLTGDLLMRAGLQLPLANPETLFLFEFTAED